MLLLLLLGTAQCSITAPQAACSQQALQHGHVAHDCQTYSICFCTAEYWYFVSTHHYPQGCLGCMLAGCSQPAGCSEPTCDRDSSRYVSSDSTAPAG
jgi:hypothetical protein